jgi:hypothetical protein
MVNPVDVTELDDLSGISFGYVQDPPNEKDFDFQDLKATFGAVTASTGDVDFRKNCTSTNQKSLGSCVGNSTADSIEILNSLEGRPHVELSRLFPWTLARNMMDDNMDGRGDVDINKGTYIRLAFDVIRSVGICPETDWPYDLTKWNRLPSLKAMRTATGHKIKSFYRIKSGGETRCDEVLAALRSEHPVVFGTQIGKEFPKLRNEGPVGIPSDSVGGHAMVCVGYISGKGFIVKNSWGRTWGDGGFWIMKPEYMGWSSTHDIWVPTRGTTFKV